MISGKAFVKISVTAGPRENDGHFTPLAQMLIAANVDRVLWSTNWRIRIRICIPAQATSPPTSRRWGR